MTPRPAAAALALALLSAAGAAGAQDLPQGPKLGPPASPLPEPACDTARPDSGDWLVGAWVAPEGRWEIRREGAALSWRGPAGAGRVLAHSACSLSLGDADGAVALEAVRSPSGMLYAHLPGDRAGRRLVLRPLR